MMIKEEDLDTLKEGQVLWGAIVELFNDYNSVEFDVIQSIKKVVVSVSNTPVYESNVTPSGKYVSVSGKGQKTMSAIINSDWHRYTFFLTEKEAKGFIVQRAEESLSELENIVRAKINESHLKARQALNQIKEMNNE